MKKTLFLLFASLSLLSSVTMSAITSASSAAVINIYVKRAGSTEAPKIHVWNKDNGTTDVAITNTTNWPSNLPTMSASGNWYVYSLNNYTTIGFLFKYSTVQTPDFKYYTNSVWVVLNAAGTSATITSYDPEQPSVTFTPDIQPQANGKYNSGQTVRVSLSSTTPNIFYTLNGSDVINTTSSFQYSGAIPITSYKRIKARALISGDQFGNNVFSNQFSLDVNFNLPTLTFTTDYTPQPDGSFIQGEQSVAVTIGLTPADPNAQIYYTTDGTDPLNPSGTRFLYAGSFQVFENKIIKAASFNAQTGSTSLVATKEFVFKPLSGVAIYVKRQGPVVAPKIHVWSKETGVDVPITNTTNWPTNLPVPSYTGSGWYKYSTTKMQVGCLFVYADKQTPDFKYFNSAIWILLDANGNLVSKTATMPVEYDLTAPTATVGFQPKANGKYNADQTVPVTLSGTTANVFYTLDGSDVTSTSTSHQYSGVINVTANTVIKAKTLVSGDQYGNNVFSNQTTLSLVFEAIPGPSILATIQPKANGHYNAGQTVSYTLSGSTPNVFYTLDGSDVTSIGASLQYTGAINVTTNTVIKAKTLISGDQYGNAVFSGQTTANVVFDAPITIYVKKGVIVYGQEPKIHVWTKETGTDVAITNTASWPSLLPYVVPHYIEDWYKYTVPNTSKELGCLFIFGSAQTQDFKGINQDTWIEFNVNGTVKSISTIAPYSSARMVSKEVKVAVTSQELATNLVLYPNPVNESLNIAYGFEGTENVNVAIFSLTGQQIYSESVSATNGYKKQIDFGTLKIPDGFYYVALQTGQGKITKQFAVKR